jgi:hypothetical protein
MIIIMQMDDHHQKTGDNLRNRYYGNQPKLSVFQDGCFQNIGQDKRVTFLGHTDEQGLIFGGITPENFVEQLTKETSQMKLSHQVEVIDLLGCDTGFSRGHISYLQRVANLLGEKGYRLRINAFTNFKDSNDLIGMFLDITETGAAIVTGWTARNQAEIIQIENDLRGKNKEKVETDFKIKVAQESLRSLTLPDNIDKMIEHYSKQVSLLTAKLDSLTLEHQQLKDKYNELLSKQSILEKSQSTRTIPSSTPSIQVESTKSPDLNTQIEEHKRKLSAMMAEMTRLDEIISQQNKLVKKLSSYSDTLKKIKSEETKLSDIEQEKLKISQSDNKDDKRLHKLNSESLSTREILHLKKEELSQEKLKIEKKIQTLTDESTKLDASIQEKRANLLKLKYEKCVLLPCPPRETLDSDLTYQVRTHPSVILQAIPVPDSAKIHTHPPTKASTTPQPLPTAPQSTTPQSSRGGPNLGM